MGIMQTTIHYDKMKSFLVNLHFAFVTDVENAVARGDSRLNTTHVRNYLADNKGKRIELLQYISTHDIPQDVWDQIMDGIRPDDMDWMSMVANIIQQEEANGNEMKPTRRGELYKTLPDVCKAMYHHFYTMVLGPTIVSFDTACLFKSSILDDAVMPLCMDARDGRCRKCGKLVR
jgi:hypothetical protein